PDGTAMNLAGNETNHPEKIKKDMHTPGSTLPISFYMNAVGYLPDGTPLNMAGNNVNHPERIGPDLHKNGSPLPPPLKGYVNDIGYTPDGTPMDKAGNLSVKKCAAAAGGLMILGSSSQACTGFAAAALAGQRASRRQNRSSALPTVVPVQSAVQRRALDQSSRYADLSLDEEYYIDPDNEEMKIAYPTLLFDRNITDGRAMMCSVLTLSIGNNQGMGDVEYGKIYDIYFPPAYLRLFDGPNCNVVDMWRILNRGMSNGGLIVGTIIKPKLGLQPKPFGEACYAFWQGGDFIKNDEPQGNQVFCQMNECIPEVVKAMRAAIKETGSSKLFSANITADDPNEMIARGKYVLSQFGPLGENCAFLVDGYVAGGTAITVARRNFPSQFLHYHRAGHGAITSPQTQRGYTAFVHTKIARVIGASGIHTGTMSFGKMEGDASDKNIAFMLQDDEADGPYYHQEWEGMKQTTPIISGGMNALRLPAFFENLGHSNVILTAGGGSFGHKDGPKPGAISCCQGEESWKEWKAGKFGDVSLSDGIIEFAKTHEELKGAFLTFQK
ncbi:unnamed protein product, partial [Polarella glacialis]